MPNPDVSSNPISVRTPSRELKDFLLSGWAILWNSKWVLVGCTLLGMAFGALLAWRAPEVWISKMMVASVQDASNEKIKGLGSLLGQSGSFGTDEMDLFATILTSERLGKQVLSTMVASPDSSDKLHSVGYFLGIDTTDPKRTERWLTGMANRVTISAMNNKASQVVKITMASGKPWLAQSMLRIAYDSTSAEVVRIRGTRLRTQLPHLEYASRSAAAELDHMSREIIRFQAQNRSIGSPEFLGKQDSLLRERGVLERKYLAIRQEVEETIINLAKMSPPCMVVDEASFPAAKSAPKRLLILLFGAILGVGAGCTFVFGREALR